MLEELRSWMNRRTATSLPWRRGAWRTPRRRFGRGSWSTALNRRLHVESRNCPDQRTDHPRLTCRLSTGQTPWFTASQIAIGLMYFTGDGVEQDDDETEEWLAGNQGGDGP